MNAYLIRAGETWEDDESKWFSLLGICDDWPYYQALDYVSTVVIDRLPSVIQVISEVVRLQIDLDMVRRKSGALYVITSNDKTLVSLVPREVFGSLATHQMSVTAKVFMAVDSLKASESKALEDMGAYVVARSGKKIVYRDPRYVEERWTDAVFVE